MKQLDEKFLNICRNSYNGFLGKENDFFLNLMSLPTDVDGDEAFEQEMFGKFGMTPKEFRSYFYELIFDDSASKEEKKKKLMYYKALLYNECEYFWFEGSGHRIMEKFADRAIKDAKEAFVNNGEQLFHYRVDGCIVIVLYNCNIIGCITSSCDGLDLDKISKTIKELYDEINMFIVRGFLYFHKFTEYDIDYLVED